MTHVIYTNGDYPIQARKYNCQLSSIGEERTSRRRNPTLIPSSRERQPILPHNIEYQPVNEQIVVEEEIIQIED